MPNRAMRICKYPGCSELVGSGYCVKHQAIKEQQAKKFDKERGTSSERGYGSKWRKYRLQFLREHPICECNECKKLNRILLATVVDHIIPHKGDCKLFWDSNNHQAMAKRCHDRKTAKEDGGFGNK